MEVLLPSFFEVVVHECSNILIRSYVFKEDCVMFNVLVKWNSTVPSIWAFLDEIGKGVNLFVVRRAGGFEDETMTSF